MTARHDSKPLPGRPLLVALLVAGLLGIVLAAVASASWPASVRAGGLRVSFNAGFRPQAISKTGATPVVASFGFKARTEDGSHPPPLTRWILETGGHSAIDVKGLPVCDPNIQDGRELLDRCRDAVLPGGGGVEVEIAFPEAAPIAGRSGRLKILNGGTRDGVTTLYGYAETTTPTAGAFLLTIESRRLGGARSPLRTVVSIPKIAGGSGSVLSLVATLGKRSPKGKRLRSVFTLECPDGKIRTRMEAIFSDGTRAKAILRRRCIPRRNA